MEKRQWGHRQSLMKERLLHSAADIVCIQEAAADTFEDDFEFMKDAGYDHVLHRKFRFRCATFFQRDKFVLENVAHKDRTLITSLRRISMNEERVSHIVNCHLSGGAAPERRLRQVHDAVDQIRKYNDARERDLIQQRKGKQPSPKGIAKAEQALREYQNAGIIVCGDFNSEGNTAVRKLLVEGCVLPDWREPQYPNLKLTSKERGHALGSFIDAAELAYGGNICDGDYSDHSSLSGAARPATYVVPNLASLLLLPISEEEGPPRTKFGQQIARGLAETLNLSDFCESEIDRAFEQVDHDGNGLIDRDEVESLLENVYVATYGQKIEQERNNFFRGFGGNPGDGGLTKEQFIARLKALQSDCEGERKAFGLARGLNLHKLSETEMDQAFERIDLDGNGLLDEDEFQILLETVYIAIYGEEIEKQRIEFTMGFQKKGTGTNSNELTREQFTERLLALHQELEGGRKGAELAEVRTEADVKKMIGRFTPLLQLALDEVFDKLSSNGDTLTPEEVNGFLLKTNGELGRGGTFRHTSAVFQEKIESSKELVELTRRDWYGIFARELAEGKWWQVVYDLEVCGSNMVSHHSNNGKNQFYQGWLDYIYFQRLTCTGVQDVLTESERMCIYSNGDALPNEWHPSDHLPVSAIFSWE
eukprot:CAMPEP_0202033350 /NCGR_PEP_ID=MMETSP0905-20130828/66003_1 /ASSEMBLY_ACC=CAM_ASM_000554 /TAXON_ID=420261 /ORGANISM="Thalassiosira antarctica, Strain CCMP982" /LENGTH=648 /DNA_ID=CAMNT_0048597251 /DNA_START=240 /DNA_END=2186 /DNA_ORIENTATION=+